MDTFIAHRLRNQWNRGFDKDKRVVWKSHRDYLSHPEQYYTVVRTHTGSSLDLVALPSESGTLTTLRGEVLPAWWIYQLRAIQDKSFSLKYAWMVNQIALAYSNYTKIKVYRSKLFEESIQIIMHIPLNQLCTLTKISLLGESGIDAGGVAREWYMLLTTALFEPKQGLFVVNKSDQSFSVNPNSARDHGSKHLERFHAIGRLLGRAIVDGQVLPFHFSVPLLKILLGYPVSMDDIRYVDPTIYSSLRYVRDAEDVDNLSLTFSVSLDASTEVDLIPNGRNVAVTNANKADYVDRMVRYLLFGSVAPQLESLVQGLYEVLPPELLMAFDYKELELVLCGFSEIDVADWKRCTNVSRSLESIVEWFWEIVENEMTSVQRERLLQFTTGSSRVPLQGFKGLTSQDGRLCPFSLHGMSYKEGILPRVQPIYRNTQDE